MLRSVTSRWICVAWQDWEWSRDVQGTLGSCHPHSIKSLTIVSPNERFSDEQTQLHYFSFPMQALLLPPHLIFIYSICFLPVRSRQACEASTATSAGDSISSNDSPLHSHQSWFHPFLFCTRSHEASPFHSYLFFDWLSGWVLPCRCLLHLEHSDKFFYSCPAFISINATAGYLPIAIQRSRTADQRRQHSHPHQFKRVHKRIKKWDIRPPASAYSGKMPTTLIDIATGIGYRFL